MEHSVHPIFLPLESQSRNRSSQQNAIERYIPDKIDFTGKYLALSYFHFFDTIHNVTEENGNHLIKYMAPGDNNVYAVFFPNGTYTFKDYNGFVHYTMRNNKHYMIDENTKFEQYGINFIVNAVYNVISVRISAGYTLIIDQEGTSAFLGISMGTYTEDFNGQANPNITMDNDLMLIHCNLVSNGLVPEFSDVIFTCPINQRFGQHVNVIPSEKRFLKCSSTCTQMIKMHLTNQDGKEIKLVEPKWGLGLDIQ